MSFGEIDDTAEATLATEFAARVHDLRARAEREGKSLRIFHRHHPEISRTRTFRAVTDALDGRTVDLMKWFDAHFFARTSLSIKAIATIFGCTWGVDDPGGVASQGRIDIARGTGPEAEAARQWCLAYNESDVAAQAAIRDGLRRFDEQLSNTTPPSRRLGDRRIACSVIDGEPESGRCCPVPGKAARRISARHPEDPR